MKSGILPAFGFAVWFASAGPMAPDRGGEAPQREGGPVPTTLVEEVHHLYYAPVQGHILQAAEQFPEEKYSWQPTAAVRSWARLVGHITDDNNMICWAVSRTGERPPFVDLPNSADSAANKASKATLIAGLRASIERCDRAFAALTPASMNDPSGLRPGMTKIGALIYNTSHTNEHYGNMVTYLRLQGLVPPSSQAAAAPGK